LLRMSQKNENKLILVSKNTLFLFFS